MDDVSQRINRNHKHVGDQKSSSPEQNGRELKSGETHTYESDSCDAWTGALEMGFALADDICSSSCGRLVWNHAGHHTRHLFLSVPSDHYLDSGHSNDLGSAAVDDDHCGNSEATCAANGTAVTHVRAATYGVVYAHEDANPKAVANDCVCSHHAAEIGFFVVDCGGVCGVANDSFGVPRAKHSAALLALVTCCAHEVRSLAFAHIYHIACSTHDRRLRRQTAPPTILGTGACPALVEARESLSKSMRMTVIAGSAEDSDCDFDSDSWLVGLTSFTVGAWLESYTYPSRIHHNPDLSGNSCICYQFKENRNEKLLCARTIKKTCV